MNELDLFKYYWENQTLFAIIYKTTNFSGNVPVSVVKKDYEEKRSEVAEKFIIQQTLKEHNISEEKANQLAGRIMLKLKQGGVIKWLICITIKNEKEKLGK